ncbi:hypothetical protein [Salinigranum sp. GCM10025319]|uniref:hypothetical protein n=1 Tax=Salinigranum sp. GCM10025319 TaxID=3252687 RepID=UPI0036069D0D
MTHKHVVHPTNRTSASSDSTASSLDEASVAGTGLVLAGATAFMGIVTAEVLLWTLAFGGYLLGGAPAR